MRLPGICVLLVVLLLGGCGDADPRVEAGTGPDPSPTRPSGIPTEVPAAAGLVRARIPLTVLAYEDEAPRVCLSGTTETTPTRCSGEELALTGFDWPGDPATYDGVRQAQYVLTGRFDGTTLAVTRARLWDPEQDHGPPGDLGLDDYTTLCPAPPGGWRVVDPARATLRIVDRLPSVAEKVAGYNSFWFDDSRNPAPDDASTPVDVANDPTYLTANLLVSKDVRGATRALRKVWGGALCVRRTRYDLEGMQRLSTELGFLPGIVEMSGKRESVDIDLLHDDGTIQRWADETYGSGVVAVTSLLRPVG